MGIKKYSVISNGEILPGFERNTVIPELARLLNVPKEIVSASLLNTSSRKLQTFDSRLIAENLVTKLRAAGLDCSISKIDENRKELNEQFSVVSEQDTNNTTKGIRVWVVVLILLIVGICMALFIL